MAIIMKMEGLKKKKKGKEERKKRNPRNKCKILTGKKGLGRSGEPPAK